MFTKTQTNEQCLFNFTVSVEFSCKYVSNDMEKYLYNIVECENLSGPRNRLLKAAVDYVFIKLLICAYII